LAGAVRLRAGTSSPPVTVTGRVFGASVKPCTAAAKPVTATQVTTLINVMVLAARRLACSPTAAMLFVSISDTPLDGEIRMVRACHSIARWLTQAGRLVAILYDSISPHRLGRDQQRHWREQGRATRDCQDLGVRPCARNLLTSYEWRPHWCLSSWVLCHERRACC
jgi:hypothetical protein